jgi:hypothetical protein
MWSAIHPKPELVRAHTSTIIFVINRCLLSASLARLTTWPDSGARIMAAPPQRSRGQLKMGCCAPGTRFARVGIDMPLVLIEAPPGL